MLATLIASVSLLAFAATPQAAALNALYIDPKKPAAVERVDVTSNYATVLIRGGRMEGEFVTVPILVQRFSFGWQPLDALDSRCRLESRALGARVNAALLRGMPALKDDRPCRYERGDVGPRNEVEAVRRLMQGPLVPYVRVAGSWAMGEWYGAGGGESLYEERKGRWKLVISDGGAMGVDYMRKYGVPESAWCALEVFDAKCERK